MGLVSSTAPPRSPTAPSLDSAAVADLVIVVAIVAGALAGWRKGFVMPVVVQAGAVVGVATLYAGPLSGAVPSGPLGLGTGVAALALGGSIIGRVGWSFVGLVYRFATLRRIDRVAGIPLGAATAAVTLYVALLGTLTIDAWLDPLHGKSAIGPQDVAAVQALIAVNPALGAFANPTALRTLAQDAALAPVPTDQLGQYDAMLAFYEQTARPQLLGSQIAPLLLAVGERLPLIGRRVDFPTR